MVIIVHLALFVKFFYFFLFFCLSASAIGIICLGKSEVYVALKGIYTKADEIPEGLSEFYVEKDGVYHLQADGLVPKTTLDEFRNNNIKLSKELEKVQQTLNGVDVNEYNKLKQEKELINDQKLIDAGQVEDVIQSRTEKMRNTYAEELNNLKIIAEQKEKEANELRAKQNSMLVNNSLKDEALKAGVAPTALPDVLSRGSRIWQVQDDNIVAMQNDTPMYSKNGSQKLSMQEWLEDLSEEAPHLYKSSSGSGATGGGSLGMRKISNRDQDALNSNLEAIASGKVVVTE